MATGTIPMKDTIRRSNMNDRFRPGEYYRPQSLGEATDILGKLGKGARVIAGGTDLLVTRPQGVTSLLDVSRLALDYISRDKDSFHIGAATRVREIENAPEFSSEPYRALGEAAGSLATATIRNMATLGGNLCNASPAADLPLPCMALDALVKIAGPGGTRKLSLADFYKGVNETVLEDDELLVEVQIPFAKEKAGTSFQKLRHHQTSVDIAIVNVATRIICINERCEVVKIVLGAVAPTPIRAKNAEALLKGKIMGDELLNKAAEAAAGESRPIDDLRASANYRKKMVKVLVERALRTSIRRCETCQE